MHEILTDAVESVVRVNDSTFAEAVVVEELIKIILDSINIIEINLSNTKIRDARIDRIPTNWNPQIIFLDIYSHNFYRILFFSSQKYKNNNTSNYYQWK